MVHTVCTMASTPERPAILSPSPHPPPAWLERSHSRSPPPRYSRMHGVPGAPRLVDLDTHKPAALIAMVEGEGDEAPRVPAQPQQAEAQPCDETGRRSGPAFVAVVWATAPWGRMQLE